MPSTVTSLERAGHRPALDGRGPDPHGPGHPLDLGAQRLDDASASVSTWRTCPGRPFFMVTGLTQASKAPASSAAATA